MIKQMMAVFSGVCMIVSIQAQPGQAQTSSAASVTAPDGEAPVYNLDFPGGTPDQLIEQMTKAGGVRPNVILPSYVRDLQLPKFKLQHVTSSQVFSALNTVVDEKGTMSMRWLGSGSQEGPDRVWTLVNVVPKTRPESCQVVFIGQLLRSFQVDDINAAIRTAWDMLGKNSTASLKFHKETKLLIAKGTDEELKLAIDVLKSLEQAAVAKEQAEATK